MATKNYLDLAGLKTLVAQINERITNSVPGVATASAAGLVKPGTGLSVAADGTLNSTINWGNLPDAPTFKTVNGEAITGTGNIAIDLNVYKVVASLPAAPATGDEQKIHLVLDATAKEGNNYKEYLYVNSKWELMGEYNADINVAWDAISGKPTTLSGYGITDAKIANGVITLGSQTITPLTQHQSLADYAKSADVAKTYLTKDDATATYATIEEMGKKLTETDLVALTKTEIEGACAEVFNA